RRRFEAAPPRERGGAGLPGQEAAAPHVFTLDERLDGLADLVARHVDLDRVRAIAGLTRT
ncbi:MAG TPA: hypothetical protein VGZ23_07080, partial [bacterium]|nr:hypothetical protein [bacterium]